MAHGIAAVCVLVGTTAVAQETFVPPEQHPMDRYERGWQKNPFTLKTAPVVEEKKSFARDLVLYNVYRVDGVTVVVANKKTKETFRLKEGEPAPNGMKIRSVMIQDILKDSYVEVELNGESAVLRYDSTFLKQMVASNSATRGGRGPAGEPGARERERMEQPPGSPTSAPAPVPGQGPDSNPTQNASGTSPSPVRPQLPQRPAPNAEPVNIRPGPGPGRGLPLPPRGTPSRATRRLLTAPPSAPPLAAAPEAP